MPKALTRKRLEDLVYSKYIETEQELATRNITDAIADAVWEELSSEGKVPPTTMGRCKTLLQFPGGTLRCTKDASHNVEGSDSAHHVNPRLGNEKVIEGDIFDDFRLTIEPVMESAMFRANIDGYGDEGAGYDYLKMARVFLEDDSLTEFFNYYFEMRGVTDGK